MSPTRCETTSGGSPTRTSGKSNGCSSSTRIGALPPPTGASTRCAPAIATIGGRSAASRCTTRDGRRGPNFRPRSGNRVIYQITQLPDFSVEIKVAHRLRDGLLTRLLQRLLEPLRQRIAARLLRIDRLL